MGDQDPSASEHMHIGTDGSVSFDKNVTVDGTSTLTGEVTTGGALNANSAIVAGANGTVQGTLTAWDGAGGVLPAYLLLHSPDGTAHYFFVEDNGTLKQHTSAPTQNSDGNEVGTQT